MTTEKPSGNGSGIFSNITVKQSMSSFAGSPKGESHKKVTNFGQMQRQIMENDEA